MGVLRCRYAGKMGDRWVTGGMEVVLCVVTLRICVRR